MANTTADKLALAAANKVAIKAAIAAKNPATAPTDVMSQWPTAIASIPSGGGSDADDYLAWVPPGVPDLHKIVRENLLTQADMPSGVDASHWVASLLINCAGISGAYSFDRIYHQYDDGTFFNQYGYYTRKDFDSRGWHWVISYGTTDWGGFNRADNLYWSYSDNNAEYGQANNSPTSNASLRILEFPNMSDWNFRDQYGNDKLTSVIAKKATLSNTQYHFLNKSMLANLPDELDFSQRTTAPNYTQNLAALQRFPTKITTPFSLNLSGSVAVAMDSVATFDSNGAVNGGLIYGLSANTATDPLTLTLNSTIKGWFTADEQSAIATALNSKGWTLTW